MSTYLLAFCKAFFLLLALCGAWFTTVSLGVLIRRKSTPAPDQPFHFAVLIPARNEERCIAAIVDSIKAQNYPPDLVDIYVIPNHCTDRTAAEAEAAGAKILTVPDAVRSKGQALHEAFEWLLSSASHDAYCVFDADNEADPEFLSEMARALSSGSRAAKSRILAKNAHQGLICACYEIYFCNANLFLNRARRNTNLSARLIGTGFALRRDLVEELGGWNTETLTEDAEFYALLSARGERITFVPGAITYDEEPLTLRDSLVQRRRWMSGIMEVARRKLPSLARCTLRGPGRLRALDALLQFLFAWGQAGILPVFLLQLCADPAGSLAALPGTVLRFYLTTLLLGLLSLIGERRLTVHTAKALPLYPLFIFSFLPLQTLSLFRPNRRWEPIRHTGVRVLQSAGGKQPHDSCKTASTDL